MSYKAKVGDIVELDEYIGVITYVDAQTTKLDWIATVHPGYNFRSSHSDADWYPVPEWECRLTKIGSVLDRK